MTHDPGERRSTKTISTDFRTLQPQQSAQLRVLDIRTGESDLLLSSDRQLFEAPNWHPSGKWIVVNAEGHLFRVSSSGGTALEAIHATGLPELNNDHLISPDGAWNYVSAQDGHIWRLPWDGGHSERVSVGKNADRQFRHYLHGLSPNGESLAFVGTETLGRDPAGTRSLWIRNMRTGSERTVGDGFSPADGPEVSPDGTWLYFNSEIKSTTAGHAQIFRSDLGGGHLEQLSFDERVNWFPHIAPDNAHLAYLSFPVGTLGHPPDREVVIRLLDQETHRTQDLIQLNGGQGSFNVNSWSPDSTKLAYVAYPFTG